MKCYCQQSTAVQLDGLAKRSLAIRLFDAKEASESPQTAAFRYTLNFLSVAVLLAPFILPAPHVQNSAAQQPDDRPATLAAANFKVTKTNNVHYCKNTGSAGMCDVFLPTLPANSGQAAPKKWPTILLVHGGGWATGDKWTMDRHARELTRVGFACVCINYRHAPTHQFPAQVDDVRRAMNWIHDQASTYGFDLDRVGMYGYSAGGHLVSLVATLCDAPWATVKQTTAWTEQDPRWQQMPTIQAVLAGGPPTDFSHLPPESIALKFFLGGTKSESPETYRAASPLQHVSKADPPFQIIHGGKDSLVSLQGSEVFHAALEDAGVQSDLKVVPKAGHLLTFIHPEFSKRMVSFFKEQLESVSADDSKAAP